jgi:ATP-binding cassette subfamily C protein LapB
VFEPLAKGLKGLSGNPGFRPDLGDPVIRTVIGGSIAINLLVLAVPLYINRIYVSVLPQKSGDSLAVITLLLAAALTLDVVIKAFRAWVLSWLGASREHRLRMGAVRALLRTDVASVQAEPLQARFAQLRSVASLRSLFEQQWLVRRVDFPFVAIYLLVLALIGGWLVLLPLLLAPVFIGMARKASQEMARAQEQKEHFETSLNDTLYASLQGAPTIKTLNLEGFLVRRLEPLQERLGQATYRHEANTARLQNLSALFSQITQLLIVSFGGWLVIHQDLSSGALAACTLLSGQVTMPLAKLFTADGQQAAIQQASHEVALLENLQPEPNLLEGPNPPQSGVLQVAGFSLAPAETLLILGGDADQSAGFLASITGIQGVIPADARFAGEPLVTFQRTKLRRRLRLLVPEPTAYRGTLLDNLTRFASNERGAKAAALCEQHGVAEAIHQLPKGYDTPIGDAQDFPLGQGLLFQLQVMAALMDEPAVLLLDASQVSLGTTPLMWFLNLQLEASRLVALEQMPQGLAPPPRSLQWKGKQLLDVKP